MSEKPSVEELKIAFAFYFSQMVMHADEVVQPAEIEFMSRVFRPQAMLECGYIDESGGVTQKFEDAVRTAVETLPEALEQADKLAMLDILIKACESDGEVDPRETTVVLQAAQLLGLSQEDVAQYFRAMSGTIEAPSSPPDDAAAEFLSEKSGTLVVTQTQLYEAITGDDEEAITRRGRLEAVLDNPQGALAIVMHPEDVSNCAIHGWQALISRQAEAGKLRELAGRMAFAIEGYEDNSLELFEIPETRTWMASILDVYPWLPVWISPEIGVGGQMVASLAELDPASPQRTVPETFFAAALRCANYAAALALRDPEPSLEHVAAFLAQFGVTELHPSLFEGVDVLARELDPLARVQAS